ncbi:hypothetical protein ANN_10798 [Periplaneta americana]|uniref:Reverse transcriptase domain-containing protein n=1 Tax=Periplaneta americana TaxID=6978 RepID=A0ABQ8T391_PERAM|nr:hypothetical protein ANN_10798 [Periplaneta americana]
MCVEYVIMPSIASPIINRKVKKNREGLKLNELHELLVYADDVNMLGENRHSIVCADLKKLGETEHKYYSHMEEEDIKKITVTLNVVVVGLLLTIVRQLQVKPVKPANFWNLSLSFSLSLDPRHSVTNPPPPEFNTHEPPLVVGGEWPFGAVTKIIFGIHRFTSSWIQARPWTIHFKRFFDSRLGDKSFSTEFSNFLRHFGSITVFLVMSSTLNFICIEALSCTCARRRLEQGY